ncbi:WD40-repeat-containing domain protein [Irpex rosettiformis]|uniref:WD40-repeat-containing domain protein n=1 Tax=Irpex rosettiformis TaxID=378272 RepID=A0ACB8UKW8_9APHY|nr:WD40-repeat-containing domain protein [Irpex rosettiformis]
MYAVDTEWPADSVEFCPHPDAVNILVCGTYNLEKADPVTSSETADDGFQPQASQRKQLRRGKCMLFALEHTNQSAKGYTGNKLQEVASPAVPDLKWCHRAQSERPMLVAANTEGRVSLHEYVGEECLLKQVQQIECTTADILCLSVDWSNRRYQSSLTRDLGNLVVSMSDGSVALLRPSNTSGLTVTDTWRAHDFEPWIAAWNYWNTYAIYTGGDDLKMKGWDTRQGFSQPTFVNKRFDAGVTTVQSHPYVEHLLAVGSYDDKVRLFDARKPLVPLTEVNVGGGAWRVKWHPSPERRDDLLVACMHDGCKMLRFRNLTGSEISNLDITVTQHFVEHKSMAYGADWSHAYSMARKDSNDSLIASCSFYDHVLHLWQG